jgi:hypothetical protein
MLGIGRLAIKSEPRSPTKAGFSLPGCSVKSGGSALYPGQMATSPLNKQAGAGQTATYAVASRYPTLTRPLQDIIDEISADYSGILRRQCSDNIGKSLGTGVDLPLEIKGKMVGVARIELATPAMSTQCSTTELHAHAAVP